MASTNNNFDVVVVGGGPAGFAAAISSARNGARTCLIEKNNFLGSNLTTGMPLYGTYTLNQKKAAAGIVEELVNELRNKNAASPTFMDVRNGGAILIDPVWVEIQILRMLKEAGVKIYLGTKVTKVIKEKNSIKKIITDQLVIIPRCVIDASGDACIAYHAGVPCEVGRDNKGEVQPLSLTFLMGNVDLMKARHYLIDNNSFVYNKEEFSRLNLDKNQYAPWCSEDYWIFNGLTEKIREAKKSGVLPKDFTQESVIFFTMVLPNQVSVLMAKVANTNAIHYGELNEAILKAKLEIPFINDFFRKYIPGFENSKVISVCPQIGIRETRRIRGAYVLTIDDIYTQEKFDDVIGHGAYYPDVHPPKGIDKKVSEIVHPEEPYDIPYRCLVTNEISNILVAGRCASATHRAMGSLRILGTCMVMGEAAGAAAALSLNIGCDVKKIDVNYLQNKLRSQGAFIRITSSKI